MTGTARHPSPEPPMDQPNAPAPVPGSADFFLDVALRIGRRVAAKAEWRGEACTWTVMSPDRENPGLRVAKPATASGTVYEGTSGIALFLAELWHAAGGTDEALARTAAAAVRYALDEAPQLPDSSFGFHGGRVGIAYAAAVVGRRLGRPELVREAEEVLRPLAGHERQDRGMDVIGGGGGAIQALVALSAWLPDSALALEMAKRLGDHLIEAADHEPDGWCWGTMRGSSQRHLCGYAHGSAGVGHAFLELYLATGDSRFRYAMEQAFVYEDRFFDEAASNWPDLRHNELGEYLFAGRQDELRDRIRGGDPIEPQPRRYMSAWCHGGPGIGLSRLRAWEVLGEERWLRDARAAVKTTFDSLADPRMNYSLCHGRGGNAETLIEATRILGEPAPLDRARGVAMEGYEAYEATGQDWPCGTMQGVLDPGLLLGESGIGYFYLRLARPETPSVLLVTPPDSTRAADDGGEGWRALQADTVREHFGRTLRLFQALGAADAAPAPRAPGEEGDDVAAARAALHARVEREADPHRRELLADALRLEDERLALAESVTDFTEEFLDALARFPDAEVRWPEARVSLSPRVRVVHLQYDWDRWVEREGEDRGPEPEPTDAFFLLQATGRRVSVRRLTPFAALVLQATEHGATVDEIVAQVHDAVAGDEGGPTREWLEDRVGEQLVQAYRAGFLTVSGAVTAAAA